MNYQICIIEDDEILGEALTERLETEGFRCHWYKDGSSALLALKRISFNVVISDIQLPDTTGEALYRQLLDDGIILPPFLFVTGYGAVNQAVRLVKLGAEDYLTKPFDVKALINRIHALCEKQIPVEGSFIALGGSPGMKAIESTIPRIAASSSTVLITGESGVGKEYVARAIHKAQDPKNNKPFIAVNCAAVPEPLMEAEFFGYQKGAFTGALRDKPGYFERASDGTFFLDEIGDMPITMQVKLLRAIQEKQTTRVGAEKSIATNARIICATHRKLQEMVEDGSFREDLYYRINVVCLDIPPLRNRPKDILWYARMFLSQWAKNKAGPGISLHPAAEKALMAYPWPGNIRELNNYLERACVFNNSNILTPEAIFGDNWKTIERNFSKKTEESLADYIRECEREYISRLLRDNNGRIIDTANALGISRKTLWEKMRKLKVRTPEDPA